MPGPDILVDLYTRVSTDMQAEEGYSLAEQESRLRLYAESQGWKVHAIHRDGGYSGKDLNRPGIQSVIADAQSHQIQKVVVYKLDRLSRSQKNTLYLIEDVFLENGVDFVSMTESLDTATPLGKAMIGILAVFAQLEREEIAERMMLGRIASAKDGNWRGGSGVPIGYRYVPKSATEPGRLVVDESEAVQVREVFRLFLSGWTYHAIYAYMRERYTNKYGSFGGGGAALIPAMLSNRAYIGFIKYQGIWYPGKHEPIIDEDTFARAQDKMAEYRATLCDHRRKPFKAGHLLTGLLFCGECGARWCFHSCTYKAKDGSRRSYDTYTCYTRNAHKGQRRADHCSLRPWNAAELEEVVWQQVSALSFDDGPEERPSDSRLPDYERQLAALDRQMERLVDLYSLGSISMEAVRKKSGELAAKREQLQAAIEASRRRSARLSRSDVELLLEGIDAVRAADLQSQREFLVSLIEKIVLLPGRGVDIHWNF